MSIYVEITIRGSMEDLWRHTQDPQLHERWDLRFSSITYLPREEESQPQRFLYSTRIGLGLAISGEGESIGNRDEPCGRRTSSLRFWSDDVRSLIREGAGYWQYIPDKLGNRFITAYDYQTRFHWAGRILDRIVFRPLMGWATAWSFDRLRLWIEKGIEPAVSMQRSLIHALSRASVGFVWVYQGLVPKLLTRHVDEMEMLSDAGFSDGTASTMLATVGVGEILLGAITLVMLQARWPLMVTIALMFVATLSVAVNSPSYLTAAFNPVSLNILVAVVATIGLMVMRDLPSARNCLRKNLRTPDAFDLPTRARERF